MLIVNADDWGKNKLTTNNILACYKKSRITSTSAMVFMEDSERAAELTMENDLDTGLHLNFTLRFSGRVHNTRLSEYQQHISSFLLRNKYFFLFYNPFLVKHFNYVYKTQYEEYIRLYNRIPTHIDGHQHMHYCSNMIFTKIIPKNFKVRRNFSFYKYEKNFVNRFYRYVVDKWLTYRFMCTDFFFDIAPVEQYERLQRIVELAKSSNVELMVHPERKEEIDFLMSDKYLELLSNIDMKPYINL